MYIYTCVRVSRASTGHRVASRGTVCAVVMPSMGDLHLCVDELSVCGENFAGTTATVLTYPTCVSPLTLQTPQNGLVIFSGTVTTAEGKEKHMTVEVQPFRPLQHPLYLCDNRFHTEVSAPRETILLFCSRILRTRKKKWCVGDSDN